jgi:hypothetical protein
MPADSQSGPFSVPFISGTTPPTSLNDYDEDPAVTALLDGVPEFGPTYLALVEEFDDDPGGPAIFTELADFVSERLIAVETERPVLERALAAIGACQPF